MEHNEQAGEHSAVDMHFDLLMDLYEKRGRSGVLDSDYLPDLRAGRFGVVGVPIFVLDTYLPEMGLRVALAQVARLYDELAGTEQFVICRTRVEIDEARRAGKIALILAMEGVEPLGEDVALLRVFHELGVRVVGLTHSRRNAAGSGAAYAPGSSSRDGLTAFGRDVVRQCDALDIILDLAHINPAGFEEILAMTSRPVIVSHANARRYYDIDRNLSDDQIRVIGQRRGVVGVSSIFVSPNAAEAHLDRYVDHIAHIADLIGIDGVGLGLDFVQAVSGALPQPVKDSFETDFAAVPPVQGLIRHADLPALTLRLAERGFRGEDIAKILYGNWMRVFEEGPGTGINQKGSGNVYL